MKNLSNSNNQSNKFKLSATFQRFRFRQTLLSVTTLSLLLLEMILNHYIYAKPLTPIKEVSLPVEQSAIEVSSPIITYYIVDNYTVIESADISNRKPFEFKGQTYYLTDSQFNDLDMVARTIFAEAGNQCDEGKLAVASVIMNRVKCSNYNFGKSVYKVLSAPNQFASWQNSNYKRTPTEHNLQIAFQAYIGDTNLPSNILFFQTGKLVNGWGSYPYYTTIQDHSFYSYK